MATSQEYLNQLNSMGDMPDFRKNIAQLYDNPVIKPLATERGNLESQYLPTVFNTLNGGTSATDMSPAAKLAAIGASIGRLGGQITSNQNIQDFYGNQIGNLANTAANQWQSGYNKVKDLYTMQNQLEEQQRQREMQQQQLDLQRASLAASQNANNIQFPGMPSSGQPTNATGIGTPPNQAIAVVNALKALLKGNGIQVSPGNIASIYSGGYGLNNTIRNQVGQAFQVLQSLGYDPNSPAIKQLLSM